MYYCLLSSRHSCQYLERAFFVKAFFSERFLNFNDFAWLFSQLDKLWCLGPWCNEWMNEGVCVWLIHSVVGVVVGLELNVRFGKVSWKRKHFFFLRLSYDWWKEVRSDQHRERNKPHNHSFNTCNSQTHIILISEKAHLPPFSLSMREHGRGGCLGGVIKMARRNWLQW